MGHVVSGTTGPTGVTDSGDMYPFSRASCRNLPGPMGPDAMIGTGILGRKCLSHSCKASGISLVIRPALISLKRLNVGNALFQGEGIPVKSAPFLRPSTAARSNVVLVMSAAHLTFSLTEPCQTGLNVDNLVIDIYAPLTQFFRSG